MSSMAKLVLSRRPGADLQKGGVAAAAARVMKAIAVVAIELPIAQRRERQLSPPGDIRKNECIVHCHR